MIVVEENIITVDTEEEIGMLELFLEEEDFDFVLDLNKFTINDPVDELLEELLDTDLETLLSEGVAKRKIVIRNGKRKIIFRCKQTYHMTLGSF